MLVISSAPHMSAPGPRLGAPNGSDQMKSLENRRTEIAAVHRIYNDHAHRIEVVQAHKLRPSHTMFAGELRSLGICFEQAVFFCKPLVLCACPLRSFCVVCSSAATIKDKRKNIPFLSASSEYIPAFCVLQFVQGAALCAWSARPLSLHMHG